MRVVIDGIEYVPAPASFDGDSFFLTLGAMLRQRRKACHLTLDAAAKRVPCSKSYLWEVEHDKGEPSFRIVAALSRITGTPLESLAATLPSGQQPTQPSGGDHGE